MEVTEVRIRAVTNTADRMKGVASVTFDGEFAVHDIRIIQGEEGLFVAMPSKRMGDGFKDVAHPIGQETRDRIESAVLRAYREKLDEDSVSQGA